MNWINVLDKIAILSMLFYVSWLLKSEIEDNFAFQCDGRRSDVEPRQI